MLRPSRPMIRPFMSSEGSSTSDDVVSDAWLAATRWSASATRFRARRFASACASSSIWRTRRARSWRTSSSERSSRCVLASPAVNPGDALELLELLVLRLLELLLERAQVRLAVGQPLLAAGQLGQLALDLLLRRQHPLLDLRHARPALRELALDLGSQADRLLPRLDLRFAPNRLGFALRLRQQQVAHPPGRADARAAESAQRQEHERAS